MSHINTNILLSFSQAYEPFYGARVFVVFASRRRKLLKYDKKEAKQNLFALGVLFVHIYNLNEKDYYSKGILSLMIFRINFLPDLAGKVMSKKAEYVSMENT